MLQTLSTLNKKTVVIFTFTVAFHLDCEDDSRSAGMVFNFGEFFLGERCLFSKVNLSLYRRPRIRVQIHSSKQ